MAGGTWRGGGECAGAWDSGSLARGWSGMRTTPTSSTATADDGTGRERRRAGTRESLLDEEEAKAGATRSRGRSGGLARFRTPAKGGIEQDQGEAAERAAELGSWDAGEVAVRE